MADMCASIVSLYMFEYANKIQLVPVCLWHCVDSGSSPKSDRILTKGEAR